MNARQEIIFTVNTLGGLAIGAQLINHGHPAFGLLVFLLASMLALGILGSAKAQRK